MRTPKQAVAAALATKTNTPGWCQAQVREWLDAPSAGDFDGDGAADAEDGWKKEPLAARRSDKTGRAGFPASFLGGSHDNGHRALFVAPGIVRSTDFNGVTKRYQAGVVGNGTIDQVAAAMGVTYVGWSTTMDGVPIPRDPKPAPLTKGWRVDKAESLVKHAGRHPGTVRAKILEQVAALLARVPKHPKR
jgi:hypothetical protein